MKIKNILIVVIFALFASSCEESTLPTEGILSPIPSEIKQETPTKVATVTSTAIQPTSSPTIIEPTFTTAQTVTPTVEVQVPSRSEPTITLGDEAKIIPLKEGQTPAPLNIWMFTATSGWMIARNEAGGSAHILLTQDGGLTWSERTPPQPERDGDLMALAYFLDMDRGWVIFTPQEPMDGVGEPFIWRTSDGGQSWNPSAIFDTSGLENIFYPGFLQFVDEQVGWLLVHVGAGMNHDYIVIYQTVDGGETWARIQDPYNDFSGIQACLKTGMVFINQSTGWLTGDCQGVAAGVWLFRTLDGGATWEEITLPEPREGMFQELGPACGSRYPTFLDPDNGYLAVDCRDYSSDLPVDEHFIYSTTDGGNTWKFSTYPGGSLFFLDEQTGWALSKDIYRTIDGAQTWKKLKTVNWTAVFSFISQDLGWAAAELNGQYGLVKTENGGERWELLELTVK